MLRRLSIRDFAVVAEAELEFGRGLTVISGETGAGKSLLVDALGFLGGARAEAGAVRHGAQRAELQAEFALEDCPAAADWLREADLDDAASCQLRRTLRADGGSRAWINGRAVPVSQLAELAALLVEIHGQHEQQALLSRSRQLQLLDAYARHSDLLARVRTSAGAWKQLQAERDALLARGDVAERQAWLRHQLQEFDGESLDAASLAELDAGHRRHANAASLIGVCESALEAMAGDDALASRLNHTRAGLQREVRNEPRLAEVDAMLDSAAIQLEEATTLLARIRDDLDLDPAALEAMEQRLVRIQDLARKHRVPVAQLQAHRDGLQAELEELADADARLADLDRGIARSLAEWRDAAAALTESRSEAGRILGATVAALIGELGMEGGRFEVSLEPLADPTTPDPNGAERVELLVSANAGQPPRPLRKVASGGELSRISLAIEVATLGLDAIPTMVFDEVDAGIGGAVAAAVGGKLRELGAPRQVLCVTHQPQVAAAGHAQYRVSKAAKNGMTQSAVQLLDAAGRVDEIARMLGGARVTDEARAAAGKLLEH